MENVRRLELDDNTDREEPPDVTGKESVQEEMDNEDKEIPLRKRLPSQDDFQEEQETTRSFKKPPPPASKPKTTRSTRGRPKKQPDIRKVLGINPELNYEDEEKLQRMILQKSRDVNLDADDLQVALALSKSLRDQGGTIEDLPTTSRGTSKANKRVVEFFEMLGMNQKKAKRTRTGTKISLLTRRNPEVESEKIQSRIESVINRNCYSSPMPLSGGSLEEFPISSGLLFDMRVNYKKVMRMNETDEKDLDKFT